MNNYDVKFWDPRKIGDTVKGRWRVRWAVAGREHCRSFPARPLADGFLTDLKKAAGDRQPFDTGTGLPVTSRQQAAGGNLTWYEHARAYAGFKWPHLAPISRRSVAEALTTVTVALVRDRRGAPDPKVLRRSLFGWAFNPGTRNLTPPEETVAALDWIAAASLPVTALEDPATIRRALDACARTLAGKPAAATTQRRKRAVFHNAVSYAVELRHLDANPVDRIQRKAPAVAQTVDRRVVAGPAQVARLLAAVRGLSDRGRHLEAFYGCLYYAYLRPSEAVMLKETDCRLPSRGWGRIDLAASAARAGKDWTDDGAARQARGLKHRAQHETRTIPIPPVLAQMLRAHLRRYGSAPDGRIFRTVRGGLIQDSAYSAVWAGARAAALTPAQHASPLARRPYDLRHAGVSLALNAGVPATEVARRAGHSVVVLLKIYAHCIDGQADAANKRITDALGSDDTSDDQGQDDQAS
jgi:site-specific recombinase XerD